MNFDGHEIYIINRNWLFDLTEYVGYNIKVNKKNKIKEYTKAFKIVDPDRKSNFTCIKYLESIPIGVVRKSIEVVKNYYKEALICEQSDSNKSTTREE